MPRQPDHDIRGGVGGQVVEHHMNLPDAMRGDLFLRKARKLALSRLGRHLPTTSPVATLNAANRFVVPWRT